ncbi:hypothetical protein EKH55_4917 [Sinorhizobium alkalisoli]|nr:hypothetical protein EKH55_4917 [Sinorhizobium alkalisoli]
MKSSALVHPQERTARLKKDRHETRGFAANDGIYPRLAGGLKPSAAWSS